MENENLREFILQIEEDEERGLLPKGYTEWTKKELGFTEW